jgi:hypothetical protein
MGHADISTTMIYVHHVPKHDAAAKLSRWSSGPAARSLPPAAWPSRCGWRTRPRSCEATGSPTPGLRRQPLRPAIRGGPDFPAGGCQLAFAMARSSLGEVVLSFQHGGLRAEPRTKPPPWR